jgi:transmembrane sensor
LIVAAAGGWRFSHYGRVSQDRTAASQMTELVTRRGQRADLLLPDGSRVTLGVGSRLRYPTRYAGSSRDLYLDGEAYFEVAHDAAKPFRVHTARGVAEDLGTAFGIRAYGAGELDVVVAEGAVVLRNTGQNAVTRDTVVLTQADLGHVDAEGRISRTPNVDIDAYLAWRQGKLVFHDTPVREVLHRLSLWYDIDLVLADGTIAERPFTASFDHEPVDRVLDVLALTMRLRYERRGSLRLVVAR